MGLDRFGPGQLPAHPGLECAMGQPGTQGGMDGREPLLGGAENSRSQDVGLPHQSAAGVKGHRAPAAGTRRAFLRY